MRFGAGIEQVGSWVRIFRVASVEDGSAAVLLCSFRSGEDKSWSYVLKKQICSFLPRLPVVACCCYSSRFVAYEFFWDGDAAPWGGGRTTEVSPKEFSRSRTVAILEVGLWWRSKPFKLKCGTVSSSPTRHVWSEAGSSFQVDLLITNSRRSSRGMVSSPTQKVFLWRFNIQ